MDALARGVGIGLEVLVLAAVLFCLLTGVRLLLADSGLGPKFGRGVALFLVATGVLLVVFFIAHLATFYPPL